MLDAEPAQPGHPSPGGKPRATASISPAAAHRQEIERVGARVAAGHLGVAARADLDLGASRVGDAVDSVQECRAALDEMAMALPRPGRGRGLLEFAPNAVLIAASVESGGPSGPR